MTLGIVKRNEEEYLKWITTEWGFLTAFGQINGEPIMLQPYQLHFLKNKSRFRWITKSRQVGYSFVFALEALARCHAKSNHTAVIVSYNQDDSKEKILIARHVHEGLPLAYQKRIKHDSKTELAFESRTAQRKTNHGYCRRRQRRQGANPPMCIWMSLHTTQTTGRSTPAARR